VGALALCLAGAAWAGAPNGAYDLLIGGDNEIWAPSGIYADCGSDAGLSVCVNSDVLTSPSGLVTGTGSFVMTGPIEGDLPMTIAGQMSGRASDPKGKVAFAFFGPVTVDVDGTLVPADTSGSLKLTCRNRTHADVFVCHGRMKLCVAAFGRRKCLGGAVETFLHAEGGPWHLFTELATDSANVVTGAASAQLAYGVPGDYTALGKYDAKKDRSKLKLTSNDPESKDKLSFSNLVVSGDSLVSGTLKFKVSGLTGAETVLPPP
jgi:hypothetical protein